MLVGDSGVGKTCLLVRYKDDTFLSGSFISTVGIDFRNKIVTIDDRKIKLQIWDTAGKSTYGDSPCSSSVSMIVRKSFCFALLVILLIFKVKKGFAVSHMHITEMLMHFYLFMM